MTAFFQLHFRFIIQFLPLQFMDDKAEGEQKIAVNKYHQCVISVGRGKFICVNLKSSFLPLGYQTPALKPFS